MLNGDYRLKDLVDILKSRGVEIVLILMSCQRETSKWTVIRLDDFPKSQQTREK